MAASWLWADDLTGAAEVAGLLAADVRLDTPRGAASEEVVHDLDLRHHAAADARRLLRVALAGVPGATPVRLKIDSQVHGPVAAYLQAMLDAGRRPVLCVANPAVGRVTRDGVHHVPGAGGTTATDLRALLGALPFRLLPRQAQLDGVGDAAVVVADAVDAGDLGRVAGEAVALGRDLVGSAAFLTSVGLAAGVPDGGVRAGLPAPASPEGLVCVVGTTEPIADAQIAVLLRDRPGVQVLPATSPMTTLASAAARGLSEARVVVLRGADGGAEQLADATAAVLAVATGAVGLALTGGHTARRVLDRLGVTRLRAAAQTVAGVSTVSTPDGRVVATKPGSYGSPTTLRDLARVLVPSSTQESR